MNDKLIKIEEMAIKIRELILETEKQGIDSREHFYQEKWQETKDDRKEALHALDLFIESIQYHERVREQETKYREKERQYRDNSKQSTANDDDTIPF